MKLFNHTFTRRAREASSHEIVPEDVFLDSQNLSRLNLHQMEGQLEKPLGRHVFYILIGVVVIILFGFTYQLFSMQIIDEKIYTEKADKNHLRTTPLFALRGTISDRKGELLAWNTTGTSTSLTEIPKRFYTTTSGFSHVLGYVSYPKKDESNIFWQEAYLGKDGLEKQYQEKLQGKIGERIIAVDVYNKIEAENVTTKPIDGENITLTIDKEVQAKLYSAIESLANRAGFTAGAGVIMDVNNGEILALTNYPEYDNNLLTNAETKEENEKVKRDLLDKNNKFLNRAVGGLFTPGSTVKPFIAIGALMEGIISPEKNIYSSGQLVIKNKYGGPDSVFKDWKAHGYVDMRKALAVSSDEYFYQVGGGYMDQLGLGILRIDKYANLFGFATTTGIDLPGENYGVIPTPEWKKKIFGTDWLLGNTYHTAIGQYGFQITPVELVRAVASLANGGFLVTPHVLLGNVSKKISLNLSNKDMQIIQEGMRQGVTDGIGGVLNISGVKVASKSGTAELGVKKTLVNSWISGFFPYDNPKYAFVVIMEKGSRSNSHGAVFAMKDLLEWMVGNTNYTK